jgi:hypothetical protein
MSAVRPELDIPTFQIRGGDDYLEICGGAIRLADSSDGVIVLAFRPTPEERKVLADGGDIYVSLLTFGQRMQPILVTAGKEAMAQAYGVPTT